MKGLLSAGLSLPPGNLRGDDDDRPRRPVYASNGELLRIMLTGAFLAAVIAVFFWGEGGPVAVEDPSARPPVVLTPVPVLDKSILDLAKEAERIDRIQIEPEPLLHLLEKARDVVPAVAKALGSPEHPIPVEEVRAKSSQYRGSYLWYKGTLEERPRPLTDIPGSARLAFGARLRTPEGDPVYFVFSVRPDDKLDKGSWVRAEGFYLKLRDLNTPVEIDRAPVLVGAELLPDFADWKAVEKLDPELLAQVRDGKLRDGSFIQDGGDSARAIDEAQTAPLWHLASYASTQWKKRNDEQTLALEKFDTPEKYSAYVRGNTAKGEMTGLCGSIQRVRTIEARANPAGIEFWTEAWIQVRELGGHLVPLWIPKRIEEFRIGEAVYTAGHFYKVRRYTTVDEREIAVPLFVAADLLRYKLPDNPLAWYIGVPALAFFLGLIAFTIWHARRESVQEHQMETAIVNLRRRRRGKPPVT